MGRFARCPQLKGDRVPHANPKDNAYRFLMGSIEIAIGTARWCLCSRTVQGAGMSNLSVQKRGIGTNRA
jgi:hypothetical protein